MLLTNRFPCLARLFIGYQIVYLVERCHTHKRRPAEFRMIREENHRFRLVNERALDLCLLRPAVKYGILVDADVKAFRLLLSAHVARVVKTAMSLLGIQVPDRM